MLQWALQLLEELLMVKRFRLLLYKVKHTLLDTLTMELDSFWLKVGRQYPVHDLVQEAEEVGCYGKQWLWDTWREWPLLW